MAVADPPRPVAAGHEARSRATAPMRLYAGDQQPIRLLAELLGIGPAELVHRAVAEFVDRHQPMIASLARETQEAFESGDFDRLASALERGQSERAARRAERLKRLSGPPERP
jgi:hypothetical protein